MGEELTMAEMRDQAQTLAASGLFSVKNPAQAYVRDDDGEIILALTLD